MSFKNRIKRLEHQSSKRGIDSRCLQPNAIWLASPAWNGEKAKKILLWAKDGSHKFDKNTTSKHETSPEAL
jgi:hypothetical protein